MTLLQFGLVLATSIPVVGSVEVLDRLVFQTFNLRDWQQTALVIVTITTVCALCGALIVVLA
jgi:hypothetical protein